MFNPWPPPLSDRAAPTTKHGMNPLLQQPYGTPHNTAPFGAISLKDFEEAMLEGIRRDDEQIDRIVNNPEKPTFDNTIIVVDDERDKDGYYDLLDRATTVFFNLLSAETNDEMDALAEKMQPLLTKHANDIRLNERLFERVRYVHQHHRRLTPEEKMLLDTCYDGFVRSGALLSKDDKERLRQLSEEASMLGLKFSQNLLKETKAFRLHLTDEADLDGLPQTAVDGARQAAQEAGLEGWVFTLDQPSYGPFMTYSTRRELRRQLYMAKNQEGIHPNENNNVEVCRRLINLRREVAQLLGYKTYADYVLRRRMAGSVKGVYRLLDDLIVAYLPTARREDSDLLRMARSMEGRTFKMEPWDTGYYSHKLKLRKYEFDAEMLRPYFELSRVIEGVFSLATRLYGITFKPNNDIPVYHPDVKAYEVSDRDGSYLAVLYADFHPRKGKQGGAWMTEYQGQWIDREGKNHRPHVSLVMNLTKPTPDKPALLTLGEVETFLHEFGHALHGMFANTRFSSLSGTNVWWDFVELPSQLMENFAIEPAFLRTFAFHYETGEPLPQDLIDRIRKSRNFMVAKSCLRQVSLGLLDMAYYTLSKPFDDDLIAFEKRAWQKAILGPQRSDTCMTTQFSHIMAGGYAAGYYSYKWAEVLDADAFSVFKRHGVFSTRVAQRFRDNVLSRGGTEHPMVLYRRFRGGEPTIDALLRRNGIKRKMKSEG